MMAFYPSSLARKASVAMKREQNIGVVFAIGAASIVFSACGGRSVGDDSDAGTAGRGGATAGAGGSAGQSGGFSGSAGASNGGTGGGAGAGPCENVACDAIGCGD